MPRVGNKKSRSGCLRCKNRKVKCDEVRPACGWCKNHDLACLYLMEASVGSTERFASSTVSESTERLSSQGENEDLNLLPRLVDRRILELGLMQYYINKVAPGFPSTANGIDICWHAQMVPQAALRSPCLLSTLFAYALLHMHIQIQAFDKLPLNADFFEDQGLKLKGPPDESSISILALHREYLDVALKEQQAVIANITHQNADGACLAAIWLAMIALVHSSQLSDSKEYQMPTQWFVLQASFNMCLRTARPLLGPDTATSMLINNRPSLDLLLPHCNEHAVFRDLLDWHPPGDPEINDTATRAEYESSVTYLQGIYTRIVEGITPMDLGRRILAFPSASSTRFTSLLTERRPRALVILAHVLAITKRIQAAWWIFQGVADYHVRGLASIVPAEWQWAMEWPLTTIQTK